MSFCQVVFLAEMLFEQEIKHEKQLMRAAALHAWLTGSAPKKTYNDFLKSIGLSDEILNFDKQDKNNAIEKSKQIQNIVNKISKEKKK